MATNDFKQLLQHHLNQTRAGLYGQFEHAFNFNEGADQDALMKIGPGQSITFSGELTDGQPCSLIASNNLTSTSGAGFAAQQVVPVGREIVIPVNPRKGTANLEFSCPTGGGTALTVSYITSGSPARWDAHDENDLRIFTRNSLRRANSVVSSEDAFFVAGEPVFPEGLRRASVAEYDLATGSLQWRGVNVGYVDEGSALFVAYDPLKNRVGMLIRAGFGFANKVVGFARGFDQGVSGEPDPLWETAISGDNQFTSPMNLKADKNGHFIAVVTRNDDWVTPNSGTFANVFKINADTGVIVATYDTGNVANSRGPCAVDPNTGNIAIASNTSGVPQGGSGFANVVVVDSDLNYISQALVNWAAIGGRSRPAFMDVVWDNEGRLYVVSGMGVLARYTDSSLTTRDVFKSLFTPQLPNASLGVVGIGHDLVGNLIVNTGRSDFFNVHSIMSFDINCDFVSEYIVPGSTGGFSLNVERHDAGPGPDLGTLFTQELSQTPPGKRNAVGAVKYQAGNITGIFFNSVDVEFDHSKWTAVHSVNGPVPIGSLSPGWEYNSPL
ncbi:MAG: hypothetical protein QQN46_06860 [Nitrosopumilus sp.]